MENGFKNILKKGGIGLGYNVRRLGIRLIFFFIGKWWRICWNLFLFIFIFFMLIFELFFVFFFGFFDDMRLEKNFVVLDC